MTHKTLTWINESSRTVYAQVWTPSAKPTDLLLLVHGLGEHSGRYENWAARFVQKNIAVYALDLHGHGRTTGGRGHVDSFQYIYDDLERLISIAASDFPEAKMHLYGHSMGGAICLGFCFFRASTEFVSRVSSLIVTGAAIKPGFEPPAWKLKLAFWLDNFVPRLALGNELDPRWLSSNPAIVDAYIKDPLVHDRISVRWFNEWIRTVEAIRLHSRGQLKPTLMLHGMQDRATSPRAAENMATTLGAEFKCFPEAFHELHHEPCQNEVFLTVITWLQRDKTSRHFQ